MSEFCKPRSYKSVSASECRKLPDKEVEKKEVEKKEEPLETLSKMVQKFRFGNSK